MTLLDQDWQFPTDLQLTDHFEGLWSSTTCTDPQFATFPFGMLTRCRRCDNCREYKQKIWKTRTYYEIQKWTKNWLVTLTYKNTKDYSYEEVQKWLKRVRKRNPAPLAYIAATEFNSSGQRNYNPHHHFILHSHTHTWRDITTPWGHGHSHAERLKRKDGLYVTKYITKENFRIRASKNYGKLDQINHYHLACNKIRRKTYSMYKTNLKYNLNSTTQSMEQANKQLPSIARSAGLCGRGEAQESQRLRGGSR